MKHSLATADLPTAIKEMCKEMPSFSLRTGYANVRALALALGLAVIALGLVATQAAAAPVLGVELERDTLEVTRSDERVNYTVTVTNEASSAIAVGDDLLCLGAEPSKDWLPDAEATAPTGFAFEWRRNGVPIPGATGETYELVAADAGKAIQCVVKGTNVNGSAKAASLPAVVPAPLPTPMPPGPSAPKAAASRPTVTGSNLAERTCVAPTNWVQDTDGNPNTAPVAFSGPWTYQWLRDGEPIPGATGQKYLPKGGAGQEDDGVVLQCEIAGTNAGGSVVSISERSTVNLAATAVPRLSAAETPDVFANSPLGTVTVEVELPAGLGTFVHEAGGDGWTCDAVPASSAEPARAVCQRSGTDAYLPPGASYPKLVVAAALGADAPDVSTATALVYGGGALGTASDEDQFEFSDSIPFGLERFEARLIDSAGNDDTRAGAHPFAGEAIFVLNKKRLLAPLDESEISKYAPIENVKQVITHLPRGVMGNARAVPELCAGVEQVLQNPPTCPPGSVVGGIDLKFTTFTARTPIYAIEPEFGTPAQFAFTDTIQGLYTFSTRVRPEDGYAVTFELAPAPRSISLLESTVTICDFGGRRDGTGQFTGCKEKDDSDANPKPLFTNPTRCGKPAPVTRALFNSWENPDRFVEESFTGKEITGCDQIDFEPDASVVPSSAQADSPTGLDIELTMPTEGLEDPDLLAQANLRRARVTFPPGMAVNPSAANGLGACSATQVGIDAQTLVPNGNPAACPDASKIGTVEIATPILDEALKGAVYVARQGDVAGALLGLYMVFESAKNGIVVKMPVRVDPDPATGQLVATVDNGPEQPFSSVNLHFPTGPQAALMAPRSCGMHEIRAELVPWSTEDPAAEPTAQPVVDVSTFQVNQGPNGGPCPSNGLVPKLDAGSTNPVAGAHSPFVMRLSRDDGTQRFTALNVSPPPGLTADLRGVPYCPDAVLASISGAAGTGAAQIASPSCPAASQVGTAVAGAGAGTSPFYVATGKAYLAGPYKGAPLSLALVTPAVAGPLDLGNVVVRTALHIDPTTARITAVSDPVPTILHGLLLDIRDIRVAIDRPGFTVNPTNCEPMSVDATVRGESGDSATVSDPFRVGNCAALGFKPRVRLSLKGGTERGDNPALRAVVRPRAGDANIARAAVTLPRSAFLDQGHIRTICTRVQFAADKCPKAAIYGRATAFTPLLDQPLRGPVYLRSSDNELPDMVADLRGPEHQPIEIEAVFRIDSVRGGIRSTLDTGPDAPVSRFVLRMQGGKKGLVQNSQNLCAGPRRATVRMNAHNGRRFNARPKVVPVNCEKQRRGKGKSRNG